MGTKYILNNTTTTAIKWLQCALLLFAFMLIYQNAYTLSHKNLKSEVENYLNSIKTLSADFVQTSGSEVSYGEMHIKKPGKLRISYLSPKKILILVKGNRISYYDYHLEEYANLPNKRSFASALLEDKINLSNFQNYKIDEKNGIIDCMIEFEDPESSAIGVSHLLFKRNKDGNVFIHAIMINDGISTPSRIDLRNLEINHPVSDSKFRFRNPNFFKK